MTEAHRVVDEEIIGSGRFQRKPRATLARLAKGVDAEDVRLPTGAEIDDLISYLSMAKKLGEMTYKQMDAFWDLNKQLMAAHSELREYYKARPAFDDGEYDERPEDTTAIQWLNKLPLADYHTVAEAAYAQFKDEFPQDGHAPTSPSP